MPHKHNLNCIEPCGRTESGGDLYFCTTQSDFVEGPDPRAELRRRLLRPREQVLREIATRHGLSYERASSHVEGIRTDLSFSRKKTEDRLPAIDEAWENLPGSYSYYDAAVAMRDVLKGT